MVTVLHVILAVKVLARSIAVAVLGVVICAALPAQFSPQQTTQNVESFEVVWRTVRDRSPDPKLNGLDWQAIHDSTRPQIEKAQSMQEVRRLLTAMLDKLASSHYAIIPREVYNQIPSTAGSEKPAEPTESKEPEKPQPVESSAPKTTNQTVTQAVAPKTTAIEDHGNEKSTQPANELSSEALVHFGNLPEMSLHFEARTLVGGAGYIRFNEFLEPATILPEFESAIRKFRDAPGVILDLRGNPGGIGIMAMSIAGFFIDKPGQKLGEMKTRESALNFVIFPRPEPYGGPLAILVDEGSASTSEILAGGLQDLGRARIFGVRTAGAALPSDIIRLPNGDGFQYVQASYVSVSGKVLEGNGVTPDVVVQRNNVGPGHDDVIDAADAWIRSTRAKP